MTTEILERLHKTATSKKPKISTVALILLLAASYAFALRPTVEAQLAAQQPVSGPLPTGVTPDYVVPAQAYLSRRPTPVGIGQTVLVNLWVMPAPGAHRKYLNHKITISKPDGTKETVTMDSYVADGTAWFEWVVDQAGTWTFKFEFQGSIFQLEDTLKAQ